MKKSRRQRKDEKAASRRHLHTAGVGAAAALSGAALGAMAGPPGAIAGAVIGGVVGTLASIGYEDNSVENARHERTLDAELGISEGDIGAPNLEHPPARIGAFSAANSGAEAYSDSAPAEGPILRPPG
jgi:hypothetical protein